MSLVLDAAMAVAWLFEEERSPAAQDVLNMVSEGGAVVPSLWRLEVANVLRNSVRKGRCDAAYADSALQRFARLPIEVDTETDARAWGAIRDLSNAEGLTTYDAAYLELAIRLNLPLASGDGTLVAAAIRHDVAVFRP